MVLDAAFGASERICMLISTIFVTLTRLVLCCNRTGLWNSNSLQAAPNTSRAH